MFNVSRGSIRLFRLAGVDVLVHWSWLLVGYLQYRLLWAWFAAPLWQAATFLSLVALVLLHEFGHALACKSVGGEAERIYLWPLGGVAYIRPPARPGAVLWSVAAGPLVNVLLMPVTLGVVYLLGPIAWDDIHSWSQPQKFAVLLAWINAGLLVFNMLPVYPLDGGQILQSLLWFFLGRARSLRVVAVLGLFFAGVGGAFAFWIKDWWLVLIAVFIAWRSLNGYQAARVFARLAAQQASAPATDEEGEGQTTAG